jgi:hypothetical protein
VGIWRESLSESIWRGRTLCGVRGGFSWVVGIIFAWVAGRSGEVEPVLFGFHPGVSGIRGGLVCGVVCAAFWGGRMAGIAAGIGGVCCGDELENGPPARIFSVEPGFVCIEFGWLFRRGEVDVLDIESGECPRARRAFKIRSIDFGQAGVGVVLRAGIWRGDWVRVSCGAREKLIGDKLRVHSAARFVFRAWTQQESGANRKPRRQGSRLDIEPLTFSGARRARTRRVAVGGLRNGTSSWALRGATSRDQGSMVRWCEATLRDLKMATEGEAMAAGAGNGVVIRR